MGIFWNLWIIVLTLICLALITWILFANRKVAVRDDGESEDRTTGHIYDGIEEYDNPLPKWWFQLFVGTLVFSAIYLVLYPGLGSFPGILGWTSAKQLDREQEKAHEAHGDLFEAYLKMPVEELAQDGKAMKMGLRLFSNNCAVCHGADGGGAYGFPNLTDDDWLYGGTPEQIKQTLVDGRVGNMPGWGLVIGENNVQATAQYVLKLSGRDHDESKAKIGAPVFRQNCAACHGENGKGNIALGAPDLTDDAWLYSGDVNSIEQTIRSGRTNIMPSQRDKLRDETIHILAAYVYSLSMD